MKHVLGVRNGHGGTATWQRPPHTQEIAGRSAGPVLLGSPGLVLSHRVCRQDDESFGEGFLPASIFSLLLQVGISTEQGEGAKFIKPQVL